MKTKYYHKHLSNIHLKAKIGDSGIIHSYVWIGEKVTIGNNVRIQAFTFIPDGVIIEDDVFIGPHVVFINDPRMSLDEAQWKTTLVKKGAKIGANVTIKAGVTIGENALVGQHSNVLKDVPTDKIVVGNPAEYI